MGKLGLVFPGQGAQHPGMGQDLYRGHQGVRGLFAEAGNLLGKGMASLCFTGPQERLDPTANKQVSVLTADIAAAGCREDPRLRPPSSIRRNGQEIRSSDRSAHPCAGGRPSKGWRRRESIRSWNSAPKRSFPGWSAGPAVGFASFNVEDDASLEKTTAERNNGTEA